MQAEEKPWLQHGNAPHHEYFVDRIRKASTGPVCPGMKFDGDCRVRSDSSGVVRSDLRAMYEECARECARSNPKPGVRTVALAVLQSDDHCSVIFGTDAQGTDAFNVWVQRRKYHSVVGQFAAAKLKLQTREPITEKRREEAWHYSHEIVLFPPSLIIPAGVWQSIFTHPHSRSGARPPEHAEFPTQRSNHQNRTNFHRAPQ